LDLSRIESGAFPLNVVDFELNELLRRVLIKFDGRLEEKNMKVELDFCEDPLRVRADIDRIEQVLSNLIDNALKYCGQYGLLRVETRALGKKVECVVSDDGAGIAESDLPHIFDRFYKADKAHTAGLGTGLGLSIVKKIIEQHGESVAAESQEGEGATFRFTLERAQALPSKKSEEFP
ncbi:MAG: cell wall metabolism sensor histidine kinase WalK, partial [Christensenellaceae bacterium]|nr:cell wall metabolism sensor histidine kinase WalK [Christensenellaceae bacterium]